MNSRRQLEHRSLAEVAAGRACAIQVAGRVQPQIRVFAGRVSAPAKAVENGLCASLVHFVDGSMAKGAPADGWRRKECRRCRGSGPHWVRRANLRTRLLVGYNFGENHVRGDQFRFEGRGGQSGLLAYRPDKTQPMAVAPPEAGTRPRSAESPGIQCQLQLPLVFFGFGDARLLAGV